MELFEKKSVEEIKDLLDKAKKVVITAHLNPDGDALGSSLALYNYLKDKKECCVILPNNIPDTFKWMPGCNEILIYNHDENAAKVSEADMIFALDYNTSSRVDKMQKVLEDSPAVKVMIDHHPNPQREIFKYIFSDPEAAATCELLYLFFEACGFEVSNDSAICLFTGLTTDTGCFQFNCTGQRTFEVASKLAAMPIDRAEIIHHIYDSYSEGRMRLQGYVLSKKMVVFEKYHTAYIMLTKAEADKFDYRVGDTEGFVNLPLSIEHVKFSAFFMERDGIIRCSFRSKGGFKVNTIAERYFNGGGHDNAAGGKSFKPLEEVVKRFVSLLPKITKEIQDK
ncbi:MAG: bifunctional oligoribonuclease/PAP phosphatase NrnA [Bacteroidales bacterium]|jgi:phosphoesterase RecJ-like protein|nr:bifunctional oligoribonuclease/PAP phosphatase NrnA [Bacteroidales bacterium]